MIKEILTQFSIETYKITVNLKRTVKYAFSRIENSKGALLTLKLLEVINM